MFAVVRTHQHYRQDERGSSTSFIFPTLYCSLFLARNAVMLALAAREEGWSNRYPYGGDKKP